MLCGVKVKLLFYCLMLIDKNWKTDNLWLSEEILCNFHYFNNFSNFHGLLLLNYGYKNVSFIKYVIKPILLSFKVDYYQFYASTYTCTADNEWSLYGL